MITSNLLLLLTSCSLLAQNDNVVLSQGWSDDPPKLTSLVTFVRFETK